LPENHGCTATPDNPVPVPLKPQVPGSRRGYISPIIFYAVLGVIGILVLMSFAHTGSFFSENTSPAGNISPTTNSVTERPVQQSPQVISSIAPVASPSGTVTQDFRADPTTLASVYETGVTTRSFDYVHRGKAGSITMKLYSGIYIKQKSISKPATCIRYTSDPSPCTPEEIRQYYLKYLDEAIQKQSLDELVRQIKSKTSDPDDRARVAISLVQNIPYDYSKLNTRSSDMSYPYGVLYQNKGVCSEKSLLLAYLLRELGYGVVLFEFESENHMAVGIQCPSQYSFRNSGHAFIETTAPSILTDSEGDYVGVGKLTSAPGIMQISNGAPLSSVSEEYRDAQQFNQLISMGPKLDSSHYSQWTALVQKYGLKISTSSSQGLSSDSTSQSYSATCDINLGKYCSVGSNCCQKDNLCYLPCSRGVWEPRDCVCIV
jgi:hypothetical protein